MTRFFTALSAALDVLTAPALLSVLAVIPALL
jgi:hypothetical protein